MSAVIKLENLTKDYYTDKAVSHILKGINLTIEEGELVSIMGASGAGKSTLMNIIGLLDVLTSGHYFLDGKDVSTLSDNERSAIRNLKIGFVFQSFYLLHRLTVIENVELPLLYRGIKASERRRQAIEALDKVAMKEFINRRPNALSGGQMQRVAIARALIASPSVILADEPTGALDTKTSKDVMNLFKLLNSEEKVTMIIVTHNSEIADQCKRIVHVRDGMAHEDK